MHLSFSASTVKSWFQYRCERKVVYEAMPESDRNLVPILSQTHHSEWAEFGLAFEKEVITFLMRQHPKQVLGPSPGAEFLTPDLSNAFLQRKRSETIAHQLVLTETEALRRLLDLPETVGIRRCVPDIIQVDLENGEPVFSIIDVKGTQVATLFHKVQVAVYALALRGVLSQLGLPGRISSVGQIWRVPSPGSPGPLPWHPDTFELKGYEALVIDFFKRSIPAMANQEVRPGRDTTFFHLYFKCEQCQYLAHCSQAIADDRPARSWNVSAVPGLTHGAKRALLAASIRTVGDLAESHGLETNPSVTAWGVRSRARELVARAVALDKGTISRLPDRFSWLMPPRTDVAIHLVVDRSPIDDILLTIGCHITRSDSAPERLVHVVSDPTEERDALFNVLGRIVATLGEVDARNMAGEALQAHLFLYEPSEGADLQAALGRHLGDGAIRNELLELVRIFPPDQVMPDPTYKGVHHLPATALRSVIAQLYLLPVKVSLDLARVTQALRHALPPISRTYEPNAAFARPFSSRLSIDVGQAIRKGDADLEQVKADVMARLEALDDLKRWIETDNERADRPFLLLNKKPFRFLSTFDPLGAGELDILLAQELLENRTKLLANLTFLALPSDQRRDRLRCMAHLRLVSQGQRRDKTYWMRFETPPESQHSELSSGTFGLILTNDDPDIRLNLQSWSQYQVKLAPVRPEDAGSYILVEVKKDVYEGSAFRALRESTPQDGWFLDEVHTDFNFPKMETFLTYLAGKES